MYVHTHIQIYIYIERERERERVDISAAVVPVSVLLEPHSSVSWQHLDFPLLLRMHLQFPFLKICLVPFAWLRRHWYYLLALRLTVELAQAEELAQAVELALAVVWVRWTGLLPDLIQKTYLFNFQECQRRKGSLISYLNSEQNSTTPVSQAHAILFSN